MSTKRWIAGGLFTLAALQIAATPHPARADGTTYEVPREGPLPEGARSFVVSDSIGISIMTGPGTDTAILGRTVPNAQFAVQEYRRGRGCRRQWLRVGAEGWLCGDYGQLSSREPRLETYATLGEDQLLPWEYVFVSRYDTRAYRTLQAATAGSTASSDFVLWEANWGFAIRELSGQGASRVVRSFSGYFLRRGDLYSASPSAFTGGDFRDLAAVQPGVPFGWIAGYAPRVYAEPGDARSVGMLERLARINVFATRDVNGRQWARVGDDRWIRADKVRFIEPAPAPTEVSVAGNERWIDVDLTSQTLVAYEGARAVYATMVSTGNERFATQPGVFRIHSRYAHKNMDNTEATNLPNHFSFADVPYVQFFDGDRGFHAVYWHDQFGVARSHGCINMAPRDAHWLFQFTSHPLPPGWQSREIPAGTGTIVRIRGEYRGPWGR